MTVDSQGNRGLKQTQQNIDKRRTILSAIKRNALEGRPGIVPISNDDLRFKTWTEVTRPESKAVVLAMMDTSGSMEIGRASCRERV